MKRGIIFLITGVIIILIVKFPHLMLNPGELSKGHQKIRNECASCHKPFWGIESNRCIECHKPEEIGMKNTDGSDTGKEPVTVLFHHKLKNIECSECHTDHRGINPKMTNAGFDHRLLTTDLLTNCNSCHQKPDDKLHGHISESCGSCHNTNHWKPEGKFDHGQITGMNKQDCASCHRSPDDGFHRLLKDNCSECHNLREWSPADFDHAAYFLLDKDHNVKCSTCHTENHYSSYTCFGCHEHNESKMIRKHREEGYSNISDCASCHRSGNEHDIRIPDNRKSLNRNELQQMKNYLKEEDKKDLNRRGEGHKKEED